MKLLSLSLILFWVSLFSYTNGQDTIFTKPYKFSLIDPVVEFFEDEQNEKAIVLFLSHKVLKTTLYNADMTPVSDVVKELDLRSTGAFEGFVYQNGKYNLYFQKYKSKGRLFNIFEIDFENGELNHYTKHVPQGENNEFIGCFKTQNTFYELYIERNTSIIKARCWKGSEPQSFGKLDLSKLEEYSPKGHSLFSNIHEPSEDNKANQFIPVVKQGKDNRLFETSYEVNLFETDSFLYLTYDINNENTYLVKMNPINPSTAISIFPKSELGNNSKGTAKSNSYLYDNKLWQILKLPYQVSLRAFDINTDAMLMDVNIWAAENQEYMEKGLNKNVAYSESDDGHEPGALKKMEINKTINFLYRHEAVIQVVECDSVYKLIFGGVGAKFFQQGGGSSNLEPGNYNVPEYNSNYALKSFTSTVYLGRAGLDLNQSFEEIPITTKEVTYTRPLDKYGNSRTELFHFDYYGYRCMAYVSGTLFWIEKYKL